MTNLSCQENKKWCPTWTTKVKLKTTFTLHGRQTQPGVGFHLMSHDFP